MQFNRGNESSVTIDSIDIEAWVEQHPEEIKAFWQYLREANPTSCREDFDRIVRDTARAAHEAE